MKKKFESFNKDRVVSHRSNEELEKGLISLKH